MKTFWSLALIGLIGYAVMETKKLKTLQAQNGSAPAGVPYGGQLGRLNSTSREPRGVNIYVGIPAPSGHGDATLNANPAVAYAPAFGYDENQNGAMYPVSMAALTV